MDQRTRLVTACLTLAILLTSLSICTLIVIIVKTTQVSENINIMTGLYSDLARQANMTLYNNIALQLNDSMPVIINQIDRLNISAYNSLATNLALLNETEILVDFDKVAEGVQNLTNVANKAYHYFFPGNGTFYINVR